MSPAKLSTILMVNDDPDDRVLACEGFSKGRLPGNFRAVENGARRPDFNLPKKDGREVLHKIRAAPMGKAIPIVS
jgi:hypothetical protein